MSYHQLKSETGEAYGSFRTFYNGGNTLYSERPIG